MPRLTSTEQAKLEHSLALAHRHLWAATLLYQSRDEYETGDQLAEFGRELYELLEHELRRGKRLRTRPLSSR